MEKKRKSGQGSGMPVAPGNQQNQRLFVISGGPSCGKTTTLRALEQKGFAVVPEAARNIIDQEAARGADIPALVSSTGFQLAVGRLQLQRETAVSGTAFVDRGTPDNLGYHKFYNIQTPPELLEGCKNRPYQTIFLLEMLPQFEQDGKRTETPEQARQLEKLIEESYRGLGYRVVRVPVMPVEKRVEFILEKIGKKSETPLVPLSGGGT